MDIVQCWRDDLWRFAARFLPPRFLLLATTADGATNKVAIGQFTKSQLENAKHSVDSDCTAGRKTWTRTSANCRIQPYFKAEFIAVRKRFHNQPTTALSGDSPWLFIL